MNVPDFNISSNGAQIFRSSEYLAIATLSVTIWDGLLTFDDEVYFVWPMPHTAPVKWLYLFTKYFSLALQTQALLSCFGISVLWAEVGYLGNHTWSLQSCRMYRTLEMVAIALIMLSFNIVLLLRIFALYGRNMWSCAFASCVVLAEAVSTAASMAIIIPLSKYNPLCGLINPPRAILLYVIGTLVSQTILLWMAYRKRERIVRARHSIACVTIRDGVVVFVLLVVFFVLLFICVLYHSPMTSLTIYWIPMGVSVATSRIILNIQRANHVDSTQQFTTDAWGMDTSVDSYIIPDMPPARHRLAW